jgi:hypothetical protein
MPSLFSILAFNHCNVVQCIFSRFQQWSGCISSFRRLSVIRVCDWSFLSTRLKDSRSVSRFGKGVKFMDNIFFLFIGLEDFNTEFRLKSLFWVYYLDASLSIRFPTLNRIRISKPRFNTKKWCINFRPNS